ncbi:membrane protein involved in the export of O-antigen and teichoic acid [Singulisphaera acidiphila DSM 18658]|uniref:Membrane protein involved in the export of O-antigen and teichoic acid n=2 Tax=Singulisphaera acidiphila TaxID=466153 RepID=L0DJP7_SINAD|nr:membrane protein involved in the export of O-antigen and teichoic acid [Singulisphaera acidiphila DSM 18658]
MTLDFTKGLELVMADTATAVAGNQSLVRQMLKSTSYYSVAIVVQRVVSILMLPLYTRYLTRADYGVLELLELVLTLASLLVSVQLSTALFYYYHHTQNENERRRNVITAFFGTVIFGMAAAIAGVVFASGISRLVFGSATYEGLVRIVLVGLGLSLPAEFGFSSLRLQNRAQAFMMITIGRVLLNVTLNVVFLTALGFGVSTMPWSSLITTCCLTIFFARVTLAENSPSLFHPPTLWKMVLYGLPLGISTAGEVILHFGDRLFLSKAVTLTDLGLYGLAYKLGMMVSFATIPFFNYWNSQMIGIVLRPRGEQTYARGATYLLLGQTFLVLLITVFIDPVLAILVEPSFRQAALFVPWVGLAYLVRGMGTYWSNTFLLINRPALVAQVTWVGSGSCLLAYATLIPRFGLWGAIAATLLGFALMASFALWKGQRLRPFQYEYGRWAKILVCGALAVLPSVLLHPSRITTQIALGIASSGLFLVLLWALRFPTDGETQTLADILRKLLSKSMALLGGHTTAAEPTLASVQPLGEERAGTDD